MKIFAVIILLGMLFAAVKHLEAGAIARVESGRLVSAIGTQKASSRQVQDLSAKAAGEHQARQEASQKEIIALRVKLKEIREVEPIGEECRPGCKVTWPE